MTSTTFALDRAIGGVFGDIIDSARKEEEDSYRHDASDSKRATSLSDRSNSYRCEQHPSPTIRLPSRPRHSVSMYLFFIVNGILFIFFVGGGIVFIILEENNE